MPIRSSRERPGDPPEFLVREARTFVVFNVFCDDFSMGRKDLSVDVC
jgi:hypothetical protein